MDDRIKINQFVRKFSKEELMKFCKEKNISTEGTKNDLAKRLLTAKTNSSSNKIIYKLSKNAFGNYVHNETNLVFDPFSKKVIGYQQQNGNIRTLNRNDIEVCNKYKFLFDLPNLLDPSPIYEIFENSEDDEGSKSNYSDTDSEKMDENESESF